MLLLRHYSEKSVFTLAHNKDILPRIFYMHLSPKGRKNFVAEVVYTFLE